jgi:CBS-domain-containing membrane protein
MKVADWIAEHPQLPVTIASDCMIDQALEQMLTKPCQRDLYVQDESGRLTGHISYRRLAHLLLAEHRPSQSLRQMVEQVAGGSAKEIMSAQFPSARPEEELDDVIHRQLDGGIEQLPVIDEEGKPLGVVNLTDVLIAARPELEINPLCTKPE